MIILLTATAIVIAGVPIAAVLIVTVGTRREETARSLASHAAGPMERAARRLLCFHATGIARPACRTSGGADGWDAGLPPEHGRIRDDPSVPADGLTMTGAARRWR